MKGVIISLEMRMAARRPSQSNRSKVFDGYSIQRGPATRIFIHEIATKNKKNLSEQVIFVPSNERSYLYFSHQTPKKVVERPTAGLLTTLISPEDLAETNNWWRFFFSCIPLDG
jgi:hypothetical protein